MKELCSRISELIRNSEKSESLRLLCDEIYEFCIEGEQLVVQGELSTTVPSERELNRFLKEIAPRYPEESFTSLMIIANHQRYRDDHSLAAETYGGAQSITSHLRQSVRDLFAAKAWSLAAQSLLEDDQEAKVEKSLIENQRFGFDTAPPEAQVEFWYTHGLLCIRRADFGNALESLERAGVIAEELRSYGACEVRTKIFAVEAHTAERAGKMVYAQELFRRNARQALEDFGPDSDESFEAQKELVRFYRDLGDTEQARGAAEVLVARAEVARPRSDQVLASALFSICLAENGEVEQAEAIVTPLWKKLLENPEEFNAAFDVLLQAKASLAEALDRPEEVLELRELALHSALTSDGLPFEERFRRILGVVEALMILGQNDRATSLCDSVLLEKELALTNREVLVSAYLLRGQLLVEQGAYDEAVEMFLEGQLVVEEVEKITAESSMLYLACALALLLSPTKSSEVAVVEAVEHLEIGTQLLQQAGLSNSPHALPFLDLLSQLYIETGQKDKQEAADLERHVLRILLGGEYDSEGGKEAA